MLRPVPAHDGSSTALANRPLLFAFFAAMAETERESIRGGPEAHWPSIS